VGAEHVGETSLGRRMLLKRVSGKEGLLVWAKFKIIIQKFVKIEVNLHDKRNFLISLVKNSSWKNLSYNGS
jgi:hypothetical protein